MATINWKASAQRAQAEGYLPGNHWEQMLRRGMNDSLKVELQRTGDLEAYLQTRTHRAMEEYDRLLEEGTPPQTARELALEDLLG